MLLLIAAAGAADLSFGPDRPGVGESTSTPGPGHAVLELHGGASPDPAVLGVRLSGRVGLVERLEVRLWSPALVFAEDVALAGGLGVGVKYAAPIGDGVAVSVVPEFFFGDGWFTRVGLNLSGQIDQVSLWGHAEPRLGGNDQVSVLLGGGVSYTTGSLTPYFDAGIGYQVGSFVGGGVALSLGPTSQIDVGVQIPLQSPVVPTLLLGASFGF